MKFKIELKALETELRKIKSMVRSIAVLETSDAIKIDRFNDTIRLSLANDSEFGYVLLPDDKVQIVELNEPLVLNAKLFFNTVNRFSKMKPEDLTVTKEDGDMKVKLSNGKNRITTTAYETMQFPEIDDSQNVVKLTLTGEQMSLIEQMIKAVHVDDGREMLQNINFVILERDGQKLLQLASTDSHILILAEQKYDGDVPVGFNGHIAFQALKDLSMLLKDSDVINFEFVKDEHDLITHTIISSDNYRMQVPYILGNYPDVDRLWDTHPTYKTVIDRNALATTLLNSMIVKNADHNDANNNIIGFKVNFDKKLIKVNAQTQIASYDDQLAIKDVTEMHTNIDCNIWFNKHFMLDILKIVDQQDILVNFNGDLRPIQMQSVDDVNGMKIKALVTPVRKF